MEFTLRAVGVVRVEASEEEVRERSGELRGTVEVFPEFEEALEGIEGYTHLFLIAYLDRVQQRLLKVKPRRLLRKGFREEDLPELGAFATDSPVRPNPIALTLVKLVRREGRFLHVEGLDLFDGTPVLDIKPYRSDYRAREFRVPEWVKFNSRPEI
ncbi:MAG: tRNA (N6-threonylcarbamoyladenosine(37)-N6)-methyltransferase TrmO [Thaumarchaeota archaeon]|nr:tRNA (N6-threonylcarbamoyladenosine(37)-N6)-methyltransferase TrmO [Candidatus Calditenuaceae archaeon]MCX8203173.1 tRNA (N6-threonylcarbamoyladenosine(37)-N6)-methyltransferase TrmO [Nitrososphaeria archaeon]MDW8042960.1 tRNA (N6-threonylcarbamoyladenosine(37)-N6)-methyltransferase TrmO [Nitrososphaerota archaeon]